MINEKQVYTNTLKKPLTPRTPPTMSDHNVYPIHIIINSTTTQSVRCFLHIQKVIDTVKDKKTMKNRISPSNILNSIPMNPIAV